MVHVKFVSKYHEAQKRHRDTDERADVTESWLDLSTVDSWRHERMLSYLDPFLEKHPGSLWLTVGDGRYAYETRYLVRQDSRADVTTSDLSEKLLSESLRLGLIQKYSVENCEELSFQDESFDFVLCKESLHHFPRPFLALYEMIRVGKRAVIIIEPNDPQLSPEYYRQYQRVENGYISSRDILRTLLRRVGLIGLVRKIRGIPVEPQYPEVLASYEPSGNFMYGISERELEKVALGIGLPVAAFATFSDYYEDGVEFEPTSPESKLFQKVKANIAQAEAACKYNLLCAVLFKVSPDESLQQAMKASSFCIKNLPKNPYL